MAASKKAWTVEMDSALISLVKDYPFLWNSNVKNFKKLYRTEYHVMCKIVDEMKRLFPEHNATFTIERVKARFKVLKLNFVREMRRQDKAKELYVPSSRRFVNYDKLSFLKKIYEKKCEKQVDISKFKTILPRVACLPLTIPVLPASPALPTEPPVFPQGCQLVILNKTKPKASEQQTLFDQFGGSLLNKQVAQRPLKPKLVPEKTYSNICYKMIFSKPITRNENKNHKVKTKQIKQSVHSVSASPFDSPSTMCIKTEPMFDEGIASDDVPSSTSSKTYVPYENSNRRIKTKRNERKGGSGVTLENNNSTKSRTVINKQLVEPISTVSLDPIVFKVKEEPLPLESSDEKAANYEGNNNESLTESTTFCKDLSQTVKEPYPELEERIYDTEITPKFGRLFIAETENVDTSSGVVHSNSFDSNSESQIASRNSTSLKSECSPVKDASFSDSNSVSEIANRNSTSLESECSPIEDASSSDFSEKEDNHESERKMNPALRVIDAVFSARTTEDEKLNELFESFGNYVSETLKSLSPENRKRIIFQIYNVLQNRND